jgi:hypothetical protein
MLHHLLVTLPSIDIVTFAALMPAAPPPIDPTNFLGEITNWLLKILSAVAILYFVIEMFKHVTASPRDFRAIGIDILGMVVLIGIAAKATDIVSWAMKAFA